MGMSHSFEKMDSLIMMSGSVLYYMIKYGDQMRVGIDIAVENNSKLSRLYIMIDKPESFFFVVLEHLGESEPCSN